MHFALEDGNIWKLRIASDGRICAAGKEGSEGMGSAEGARKGDRETLRVVSGGSLGRQMCVSDTDAVRNSEVI